MSKNRAYETAEAIVARYLLLNPAATSVVTPSHDLYVRAVLIGQALNSWSATSASDVETLCGLLLDIKAALNDGPTMVLQPSIPERGSDVYGLCIYHEGSATTVEVSAYGTPQLLPCAIIASAADYGLSCANGQFSPINGIPHTCLGKSEDWEALRQQAEDVLFGKRK